MTLSIVLLVIAALSLANGDRFDVKFKELENKVEAYRDEIEANKVEIQALKSALNTYEKQDNLTARQSRVEPCSVVRSIPKSCRDIAKLGVTEPGIFNIDFDGVDNGLQGIDVFCDFEKRTTTIGRLFQKNLKSCSRPDCFTLRIYHDAPLEQIRALIAGSKHCHQNITVECTKPPKTAKDNKFITWKDFNGDDNEVKGSYHCNTNENIQYQVIVLDDKDVRYTDVIALDDPALLPIANVAFDPPIDEQKVKISVSPLSCTYQSFDHFLVIVSGFSANGTGVTEAVNLDKRAKCPKFKADFSARVVHSTGGLVKDSPMVCGGSTDPTGSDVKTDCWRLTLTGWVKTESEMNQMRALSAGIVLKDSLLLAGGYNSRDYMLASSEMINSKSSIQLPNLKTEVYAHCMVSYGNKIMVIGGFGRNGLTNQTQIYDLNMNFIGDGPSMVHARSGHGCSTFYEPTNDHQMVIVIGDFSRKIMPTAEILDVTVEEGRWQLLEDIPMVINSRPTVLPKPDQTGVIVYHVNKLYESKYENGTYVFEEIFSLELTRYHALALYAPGYLLDDC